MKQWPFFVFVVGAGLIQISILEVAKIAGIKPDLLLISMVLASLVFDLPQAMTVSLFCGLMKDIFATSLFGPNVILFVVWSLLIVRLNREISIDNNYLRSALVFVVSLVHATSSGLIFIASGAVIPFGIFLKIVVVGSVYTAVVLPLVVKAMQPLCPKYSF